MKKISSIIVVLSMAVLCLAGCGTTEKQEAILQYCNTDVKSFQSEVTNIGTECTALGQMDYINDAQGFYDALTGKVLPACDAVIEKVKAVSSKDSEVQAIHDKLIKAFEDYQEGFNACVTGLENADTESVTAAMATVANGTTLINEWKTDIEKLCKDNDIETTTE